jgi:hypothetical protein
MKREVEIAEQTDVVKMVGSEIPVRCPFYAQVCVNNCGAFGVENGQMKCFHNAGVIVLGSLPEPPEPEVAPEPETAPELPPVVAPWP